VEYIVMKNFLALSNAFVKDEDGAALTEYLILLGLIVGGVVAAVTTFGTNLAAVWTAWATWVTVAVLGP
jgi:pilus assembly protein Flp/PilA